MRERSWRSLGLRFSHGNTNVPFGLKGEKRSRVELIKN